MYDCVYRSSLKKSYMTIYMDWTASDTIFFYSVVRYQQYQKLLKYQTKIMVLLIFCLAFYMTKVYTKKKVLFVKVPIWSIKKAFYTEFKQP